MLIEFKFENFKNFHDETIFSMEATSGNEFEEMNTFIRCDMRLIKSALVFGANSSGKTNFLDALSYMKNVVTSNLESQSDVIRERNSFFFNTISVLSEGRFEARMICGDVIYRYGFAKKNNMIPEEYLYRKRKRETLLFRRTTDIERETNRPMVKIETSSEFDMPKQFHQNIRSDVLFISFAHLLNIHTAEKVIDCFKKIIISTDAKFDYRIIDESEKANKSALEVLRYTDKNINDVKLVALKEIGEMNSKEKKELAIIRDFYDANWNIVEQSENPVAFDEFASSGTKHIRRLLRNIFYVLEIGGVFVIDEIDKHLHPLLTRKIIGMFNSIEHNPNNAQLICTVHDALLLKEDIRRDQFYFIDKDDYGRSSLYSLSDFSNVRKDSDVLRKYLFGAFGAIPKID